MLTQPLCLRRVYIEDWETFYHESEKLYIDHPAHVRLTPHGGPSCSRERSAAVFCCFCRLPFARVAGPCVGSVAAAVADGAGKERAHGGRLLGQPPLMRCPSITCRCHLLVTPQTRYSLKYRHIDGKVVLKVTNDRVVRSHA